MSYKLVFVIQNVTEWSEESRVRPLIDYWLRCVLEILPPFGRLNDKKGKGRSE